MYLLSFFIDSTYNSSLIKCLWPVTRLEAFNLILFTQKEAFVDASSKCCLFCVAPWVSEPTGAKGSNSVELSWAVSYLTEAKCGLGYLVEYIKLTWLEKMYGKNKILEFLKFRTHSEYLLGLISKPKEKDIYLTQHWWEDETTRSENKQPLAQLSPVL